jgi:hypothetical protein
LKQKDNNINNLNWYLLKEKRILFLVSFFLLSTSIFAQKILKKSLNSNATKIIVEFNIIDQIDLITTEEKNRIIVIAESESETSPKITLEENNGIIFIKSNEIYFEENTLEVDKLCSIQPDYASYQLIIPKNKKIDISYTNGNFYSNKFVGNLNLKVEEGIVKINKFKGSVFLHINSGNVYFDGIRDTKLNVRSNLGIVSSNLYMKKSDQNKNYLNGVFEDSINELKVNAIIANIHLRSLIN